ncbi:ABC transporter permease [Alkalihalobacillus trypoxylicola]|uniref:ABC-2 type transporter transmembrane domain-containing protein n=1 Tax=Alkalihalobacillus trypoxylicola TaxID=519424 RepID=A0A162FCC4_9BACI|nr:ABC transporter permease [Alkalihalobacillus trypoxylicola]KYG35274.1 hypothetical protein AZF04_02755 [Alkalihalobacillus trypoxylicola]
MMTIYIKEWKSYFYNGTGFLFLTMYLLIFGLYFTFLNIIPTPNNAFNTTLSNMVLIFILISPILTMRTISEERRSRTDQLLLTSPKSIPSIVIGKFLAAASLFFVTLFISISYILILQAFGNVAIEPVLTAFIGFYFMGTTFIALGILISSLTESQVSSGILTLGTSIMLWVLGPVSNYFPTDAMSGFIFVFVVMLLLSFAIYYLSKSYAWTFTLGMMCMTLFTLLFLFHPVIYEGLLLKVIRWLSLPIKSEEFFLGILNVSSLIYYLSFMMLFLFLTIKMITKRRWS